ncbi:MAG: hypothetical protein WBA05_11225 [Gordonia sp. (in: high G+C Gram-positive bacteria)]|uniref:hypothetical protein n=1 Tax=Gordonia TaxID=2053 RepID=UPI003264FFB4
MYFVQTTRRMVAGIMAASIASMALGAAPASARPTPPTSCLIDASNDARTVASLMNGCSTEEILALFAKAPVGTRPVGRKTLSLLPVFQLRGDHLPYDAAKAFTRAQSTLGDALTFTTRQGEPWVYKNYAWGRDAGAPVVEGTSRVDGGPVYAADFSRDFNGLQISLHEYRQLTPGVWIARDIGGGSGRTDTPTGGVIALH